MIGGIEHPSWCERRECTVDPHSGRGAHASRPVVVGPEPRSGLTMRARLVQPPAGGPEVEVSFPGGQPAGVVLGAECARALGWVLLSLGREAERSAPPLARPTA